MTVNGIYLGFGLLSGWKVERNGNFPSRTCLIGIRASTWLLRLHWRWSRREKRGAGLLMGWGMLFYLRQSGVPIGRWLGPLGFNNNELVDRRPSINRRHLLKANRDQSMATALGGKSQSGSVCRNRLTKKLTSGIKKVGNTLREISEVHMHIDITNLPITTHATTNKGLLHIHTPTLYTHSLCKLC